MDLCDEFYNHPMGAGHHHHGHADPLGAGFKSNTARVSVMVAVCLLAAKIVVGVKTGWLGVVATAVDSAMDMLASLLVYFSIRKAHEAPDEDHAFGHGKAESLAALAQSALIALASVEIIREALSRLQHPGAIHNFSLALISTGLFAVVTLLLTLWMRRRAALSGSLALKGDSAHYATDMVGYLAVFLGLLYGHFAKTSLYDTVASVLVAGYLLTTAAGLARESIDELMDKTLDEELTRKILETIEAEPEVRSHHLLKTRKSGPNVFVEFHAVLRPEMSFLDSHRVVESLSEKIEHLIPGCRATIHADPWDDLHEDIERENRAAPGQ